MARQRYASNVMELLFALLILGGLLGILVPVTLKVQAASQTAKIMKEVRQTVNLK